MRPGIIVAAAVAEAGASPLDAITGRGGGAAAAHGVGVLTVIIASH